MVGPDLATDAVEEVDGHLAAAGVRVLSSRAYPDDAAHLTGALEWEVRPDAAQDPGALLADLRRCLPTAVREGLRDVDVDVLVAPRGLRELPRLVVLDVDSTLITGEVVELLAARAGREAEVAAVTEAAMRGEVDFAASLHARVAELAGLPVGVLDDVLAAVRLSPGARELAGGLAARGVATGVVSGGFAEVVEPLAEALGIPHTHANRLEVSGGRLTGRVLGDVVDAPAKETFLRALAAEQGVPVEGAVAVGDGANDVRMVRAAGVGVAFRAKPALREVADVVLGRDDLSAVLRLLGPAG